ncbi:MAG: sigma-54-dependent Fis family transcriptional regulator [Fibrobacteria bacterium]|nr:sigma-54-dependent Fis family transcriptional regulator [Fibrobacteria bacterium]
METIKYPKKPVLLVDDEAQLLQSASFSLRTSGVGHLIKCQESPKVMELLETQEVSAIVLDILMPNLTGKELLPQIHQKYPHIPVIMLTALNEIETAVECMKLGAFDYLVKPVDKTRLVTSVKRAVEHSALESEKNRLKDYLLTDKLDHPEAFENIVTRNKSMRSIFQYIEAIADTPLPVLITGDTGSGKEMIAQAVHKASNRQGEFVTVNVAGLDDNLFSDTLFGHAKGAFTGADKARQGLIGKAAGGTIFLDEIGDLALESQVKLLRLLEERTYYTIGSDNALPTDARVVVATNIDLETKQQAGEFRSDLFYRLQNHHIQIPALKDRKDDIQLLTDYFLEQASSELHKNCPTPPPELYKLLCTYSFPGNVRELKGMVYDAVSRHLSGILSMDPFKARIEKSRASAGSVLEITEESNCLSLPETLPTIKEIDEILVEEALKRAQGNQTIAAQMIGLTRSALNKRLNRPK